MVTTLLNCPSHSPQLKKILWAKETTWYTMYTIHALRTAFYRTHVSLITQQMCAGNSELSLHIDPNEYCTIQTSKCTLESSNCTLHTKHTCFASVSGAVFINQPVLFTCTKLYQIMLTSSKNCTRYCLPAVKTVPDIVYQRQAKPHRILWQQPAWFSPAPFCCNPRAH